jgi:4'-phosphopantetheinyl transferase
MKTGVTDKSARLQRLEHEVHVWFTRPEAITDPEQLAGYAAILSPLERERQQRFHFEEDRHRFLVSHALVRRVLSRYVDVAPGDWGFSVNQYGRPEISGPEITPALRFNLSHTVGLACCVVTLDADCGIDVEQLTARGNQLAIAEKMFAVSEQAELKKLDGQAFQERFFCYWTLREAYCKAVGTGIGHTSNNYAFEVGEADQCRISFGASSADRGEHWQFTVLRPGPEHLAAVAIRSGGLPDKPVICETIVP